MMEQPTRSSFLKTENKASAKVQRAVKSRAKPQDLHEQALHSIVAFAELIGFQGGWGNFGDCHTELAG